MEPILIKAFGVCTSESKRVERDIILPEAIKRGFLICDEIMNKDMLAFLKAEEIDHNSTFYKSWEDMSSKSRIELLLDQVAHYLTTYGTDFQSDYVYTCNDDDRSEVPDFNSYKVIEYATIESVVKRCSDVLCSGIAMSTDMVSACVKYIANHEDYLPSDFNVDDIRNREAMTQLCDYLGIHPHSGNEIVRWLVYKATGNSMVIKDNVSISLVRANANNVNFTVFNDDELVELSKVFFRYKPIILGFRESKNNRKVINRIRRMAEKNHVPMKNGFWQTVLSEVRDDSEIKNRLHEINCFKIVSLLQTIKERIYLLQHEENQIYFIRNGKAWVDSDNEKNGKTQKRRKLLDNMGVIKSDYLNRIYVILYNELVSRLQEKKGTVRFPKTINLACPVSEKMFAGNLPYGSSYQLSKHNYFGIYWRAADGTNDFDLSFINKHGAKIGWNRDYRSGDEVLFSGDMTSAHPCATEVLYFRGGTKQEGILWNNRYCGNPGSKFKYFIGREEITDFRANYMVDPNTIDLQVEDYSVGRQCMLGAVIDNKIYPCKFTFGNSCISLSSDFDKFSVVKRKLSCCLDLKKVLLDAGFIEWSEEVKNGEGEKVGPDYDLCSLNKDTLINLFRGE